MDHYEILKSIALVQRDNGTRFTRNDKLDRIRKILNTMSEYHELYAGDLTSVWAKGSVAALKQAEMPVLLTSHIDNVKAITKPFVAGGTVEGVGPVLRGTFDNMITNAALIDLMLNQDMPDNVVFCFDGDEETGLCRGLKEAVAHLKEFFDNDIGCAIATDVTYEGFNGMKAVPLISKKTHETLLDKDGNVRTENRKDYSNYKLFSIENMSGSRTFQNEFANAFLEHHSDDFAFAPHPSETYKCPEGLKPFYKNTGDCDEGYIIRNLGLNGMSICLPVKGPMHSDDGCITRFNQYDGYCRSLGEVVNMIATMDKEKILGRNEEYEKLAPEPSFSYRNSWYTSQDSDEYYEQLSLLDRMREDEEFDSVAATEFLEYIEDETDPFDLIAMAESFLIEHGMDETRAAEMASAWLEDYDYNYSFGGNEEDAPSMREFLCRYIQDVEEELEFEDEEENKGPVITYEDLEEDDCGIEWR